MAQNLGGILFRLTGISFLFAFLVIPLALLLLRFEFFPMPGNLLLRNAFQALLSASLAVALAFPLAFALTRQSALTKLLNALSLVPLVLPQPAMILSLIVLFGANGAFSLPFSLYGLEGIVLAHALYNFPLAARIISARWAPLLPLGGVAASLGASKMQSFLLVTLPSLRPAIHSAFLVAFAFSFASFSIPLVFGGTLNSTMEVEIFRTFFRDFNFSKGIFLALLQLLVFLPLALAWSSVPWSISGKKTVGGAGSMLISAIYLAAFSAILLGPFLRAKIAAVPLLPIYNSLILAILSSVLCVMLWISIGRSLSKYSFLLFGVSPAILAVSFYFLPYSFILLPIGHALLSFALVSSILLPIDSSLRKYEAVAKTLGASAYQSFRHVYFPNAKNALILAFLFSFAFSLGETAFLLSISQSSPTMSMALMQAFSSYRFGEGYFYVTILISISIFISLITEGLDVFSRAIEQKV